MCGEYFLYVISMYHTQTHEQLILIQNQQLIAHFEEKECRNCV
jgi:hypothetical protein